MQQFNLTFIFDGYVRQSSTDRLCPTYIETFKASDYRTAIEYFNSRVADFPQTFAAFLHDDRGAVVYNTLPHETAVQS